MTRSLILSEIQMNSKSTMELFWFHLNMLKQKTKFHPNTQSQKMLILFTKKRRKLKELRKTAKVKDRKSRRRLRNLLFQNKH